LIERSDVDGSPVRVQYFQRAILKYDEQAIAHFDSDRGYVTITAMGTDRYSATYPSQPVTLPVPAPTQTPDTGSCPPTPHGPSVSDSFPDPPARASVGKGLVVRGTVRSSNGCAPIKGATLAYVLAGPDGQYDDDHQGKVFTDANGIYTFE